MKNFFHAILASFLFILPQAFATKPLAFLKWQTSNGARVIFYQAMEVPMLDISVAFAAGSTYDEEQFGLSALTTRLLSQGDGGLSSGKIAKELSSTGAQYAGESNRDMAVISLRTLTDHASMPAAIHLFSLIINHPNFSVAAFSREKNQQLMAIAQALQSPDEIANQLFFKTLYNLHPYAHPVLGTEETVKKLNIEQVRHFYQQFFVGRNAVIVLVGAIDVTTAHQLAEQLMQDLPPGLPAKTIPLAKPLAKKEEIAVPFLASQTAIRLGQIGINHHSKNFFPLLVGNYILGGGMLVSKLAIELREKRGLTYGVYSHFLPMPGNGPFLISLSTQNKHASQAIDVARETLTTFIKQGPSEQELEAAKHYLTGSFPLSLASNRNIADLLLKIAFYHLPENFLTRYPQQVNAVTAAEIKQALQALITPNQLLQISVGAK